jgi:hypothetical protein
LRKIEYKVAGFKTGAVTISLEKYFQKRTDELNKLGSEGWELVTSSSGSLNSYVVMTFKREVN